MAAERHDERPDDFEKDHTVAETYAPPEPGPNAGRSRFMLIVSGVVALCIVVFMLAVLLR